MLEIIFKKWCTPPPSPPSPRQDLSITKLGKVIDNEALGWESRDSQSKTTEKWTTGCQCPKDCWCGCWCIWIVSSGCTIFGELIIVIPAFRESGENTTLGCTVIRAEKSLSECTSCHWRQHSALSDWVKMELCFVFYDWCKNITDYQRFQFWLFYILQQCLLSSLAISL